MKTRHRHRRHRRFPYAFAEGVGRLQVDDGRVESVNECRAGNCWEVDVADTSQAIPMAPKQVVTDRDLEVSNRFGKLVFWFFVVVLILLVGSLFSPTTLEIPAVRPMVPPR
jgi:hypothetical protein